MSAMHNHVHADGSRCAADDAIVALELLQVTLCYSLVDCAVHLQKERAKHKLKSPERQQTLLTTEC